MAPDYHLQPACLGRRLMVPPYEAADVDPPVSGATRQVAAERGRRAVVWQLSHALDACQLRRGYHQRALARYHQTGDTFLQANTLDRLGAAYLALGRSVDAHRVWRRAWGLYVEQHRTGCADRVRELLARL